jgi:hypothetical protein
VTGFGIETPIAVTGMNLPGLLVTTPDADSDAALDQVRKSKKQAPLEADDGLDELAESTARAVARRQMSTATAGRRIDDALSRSPDHWSSGRTVFAVASDVSQIGASMGEVLADPAVTHLAVGVEPTKRPDGGNAVQIVIILATKR